MKKIIVLAVCFFATGCASLHQTGYLNSYDNLENVYKFSEFGWKANVQQKAFVGEDFIYSPSKSVQVKQPTVAETVALSDIEKKMYADALKNSLEDEILKDGLFQLASAGADLELHSFIGVMDPGNGFMRWFFGMGMGKADFQVESKMVDTASGDTVMTYAYRTQDTGSPLFGLNLSELDDQKQVKNAMEEIGESYAKFLKKEFKE